MTEQDLQITGQHPGEDNRKALFSMLLIGTLSMLFAEVFSGSSRVWFIDGWGLLMTFPLYLGHVLFFLFLAFRFGKTSLPQLYLFGVLFGLYESWITKVLWAGFPGQAGPMAGTIAGLGILEFPILVFFWHPVMAFVLPILIFEIITGKILKEHALIITRTPKKTKSIILFLVLVSAFTAMGNGYNLISANSSLIGTLLIAWGLYRLAKRSDIRIFEFKKTRFAIVVIYLAFLYGVTFFILLPEKIPHAPMPYISIIIFYAFCIFIIRRSRGVVGDFVEPQKDHYSMDDLKKFALILIAAVNVAIIASAVSVYALAIARVVFPLVGLALFAAGVHKIARQV